MDMSDLHKSYIFSKGYVAKGGGHFICLPFPLLYLVSLIQPVKFGKIVLNALFSLRGFKPTPATIVSQPPSCILGWDVISFLAEAVLHYVEMNFHWARERKQ